MSVPTRARAFLLCPEMFEDPRLASLRSSRPNRQLVFDVLTDPGHGPCDPSDIIVMSNEPTSVVKPRLEHWFASASSDETLILYYTGHGLTSPDGELRLATATAGEHGSHAVSGSELTAWISGSRAPLVYVIVDAAHAGPQDLRTDGRVFQIMGDGDSVMVGSPAGEPSAFTLLIAAYFESTPEPSLADLFDTLRHADPTTTIPWADVPWASDPATAATPMPAITMATPDATTPAARPAAATQATRMTPAAAAASAGAAASGTAPARRTSGDDTGEIPLAAGSTSTWSAAPPQRSRRWVVAGAAALILAVGVGGALTRCGGDDEEAGSTVTDVAATGGSGATTGVATTLDPTATTAAAVTVPPTAPPTEAPTTEAPVDVATTEVASKAPTTTATPGPASIELNIPNHPLATPACTGGWIAQIASVDSTSEFAKASVTELLQLAGTSYAYAPDSCSTFDKGGRWYVVFLGPFTTKADADAACEESGDEDCFARQLQ